jgi:hypothetical protein
MKKIMFFVLATIFILSASTAFAVNFDKRSSSDNPSAPDKRENKLSEEELSRLTKRAEEIRGMDKTNMTVKEKRGLKKELKTTQIYESRRHGGYVYIGGGLLLLIILIILLV